MVNNIEWNIVHRQNKTLEKELNHARLWILKVKKWSAKFTKEEAPESLDLMDKKINNIEIALQRVADPEQLNQPELARDLAVLLSDYYDKRGRWDDWIRLGPPVLDACVRIGDDYSLGQAYPALCNGIGLMHRMLGNLDKAMSYYKIALERASDEKYRSDALTSMADIHRLCGETEKALVCAKRAVELGQRVGDKTREAQGLEYMGLTYTALKTYDKAVECHRQALTLRKETGNLSRIALALDLLSVALTERGTEDDLKEAIKYYQHSLTLEKQLNNSQRMASSYAGLGNIYLKLGEHKKAIDNYEMALALYRGIGFLRGCASGHIRLAFAHAPLNQLDTALFHAKEVCKHRQHMLYPDRLLATPLICQTLLKLVESLEAQQNLEQIREFAELAIEFATEAKDNEWIEILEQRVMNLFPSNHLV
ncbi:MAG: tetratricopeptide repeat protein [Symploca sp. SIO1A3]|nr:tetratricopeptide repeat protein [Symploca sp. SIO1A3]